MTLRYSNPPTIARPTGYTHVVEATGAHTFYISGQVALDASGAIVGQGDMRAQAHRSSRISTPRSSRLARALAMWPS